MLGKARTSLLALTIIAVLVFSAVGPTVVYADGETPTDTPPQTETSNDCTSDGTSKCPAEDAATQAPDTSDGSAEAVTQAEATPVPTGEAAGDATVEAAAPAPTEEAVPAPDSTVLDQVPENTTVTVLNVEGESQPLATQDAADAIAESDPIWCPQGQTPTPGANGCTASYTSFTDLLNFLSGNTAYQGAGTIYVQQGAYHGGESSIDLNSSSYDLSNINSSDLTITGGWNTSNNTIDPAATSNFTVPIYIGTSSNPWGGSLTVNNISIDNTSGTGITLFSDTDINLTNVTVKNSPTGSGAELTAGGNVTIESSEFVRNKVSGATIRSRGSVAISNSNFSNRETGMARRQITGLDIVSDGSVSLFNVMANGNREVGANINSGGRVTIVNSVFSGTKTINSGAFLGYGLQVVTPDIIDLDTVTANDNFLWGALLNAGGDVNISNSIFNANTTESPGFIDDTGLLVTSGGNVSINNSQANDNRLIGATINATGDVAVNNSSFSNNNGVILSSAGTPTFHGYGLQVVTLGNIFINAVTASNNTLFGAHLDGGLDVIVSESNFSNQTSGSTTDQTGRGLEVTSDGNVFLDTVTIDSNQTLGGDVQAAGDVFLDNVTVTNNGQNGLTVTANCTTVYLINGNYSNNGQYGLRVINAMLNQSGSPLFAGNGTGDIFHTPPGTCNTVSPVVPNTPTTGLTVLHVPGGVWKMSPVPFPANRGEPL